MTVILQLTQKSLLFESVLIHKCKQRISCSIIVVLIEASHAVSSFALQQEENLSNLTCKFMEFYRGSQLF